MFVVPLVYLPKLCIALVPYAFIGDTVIHFRGITLHPFPYICPSETNCNKLKLLSSGRVQ